MPFGSPPFHCTQRLKGASMSTESQSHVAMIGGGIAGLTAALRLASKDFAFHSGSEATALAVRRRHFPSPAAHRSNTSIITSFKATAKSSS